MVYVFTNKKASVEKTFPKNTKFQVMDKVSDHAPADKDKSFIDITGIKVQDLEKILTIIKNPSKDTPKKESSLIKTGVKFPPVNTFPGWKNITSGKTIPFYLLYCSIHGKSSLDTRYEEKAIAQVHKRLLNYLSYIFDKSEGQLWMNSGKDCLFLFPPRAKSAEAVIEACIRMIISAPLITMENLGISEPVNFNFALHYGTISYKPPGKTGTVVSDAVNAIFHLGAKKSEAGRLTVSGDIPDGTIPKSLEDCFVPAGVYEGRKIWHTRKFCYEKTWT